VQISKAQGGAPDTYAPFTIDEYRSMPLDYAFIDECVQWPAAASGAPAVRLLPAGAGYPDVPVLVISGELDNMTSPADGAAAAARFPRARHVVIANSFHVNALPHARSDCGAILVRRFMERLETGDEGCAAAVPRCAWCHASPDTCASCPPRVRSRVMRREKTAARRECGAVDIRGRHRARRGKRSGCGVGLRGVPSPSGKLRTATG